LVNARVPARADQVRMPRALRPGRRWASLRCRPRLPRVPRERSEELPPEQGGRLARRRSAAAARRVRPSALRLRKRLPATGSKKISFPRGDTGGSCPARSGRSSSPPPLPVPSEWKNTFN